jgi:serine/threonine protein kinase
MMSIQGDVKIIDFGLAIDLNNLPPPVSLVGSPFWIPPEMLLSTPHGTPADIWSFGICVLELADGEPPNRRNALKALYSVATGVAPRLKDPQAWSPEFNDFVAQCLTIDQHQRGTAPQLLGHPFLSKAATRRSMKQILQHLFIEKSLEKSLGMRGF